MIQLIQGDCLELMKGISDKSIDMILCDLPYGLTHCDWDIPLDMGSMWDQYKRIIKDHGAILLFSIQPFTSDLIQSNRKMFRYEIVWKRHKKAYKDKAWKSYRHEDGEYCFGGGWFIVGIDTPEGSYTYHYENKYWGMFDCVDLPRAKHWDGHTEADAETRLMSLVQQEQRWISCSERMPDPYVKVLVSDVDGNVGIAWFEDHFSEWWSDRYGLIEVLAWMPLPDPYKERREE